MNGIPTWVEIPTSDIDRAAKFYGAIFGKEITVREDGPRKIAILGQSEDNSGGASLTQIEGFKPSSDGALAYFNAEDDIDGVLKKISASGGTVVIPKTNMWEGQVFATFLDSEGNTVALFGSGSV
jgi:predicted enzyme related to lactoylglutathione lyase